MNSHTVRKNSQTAEESYDTLCDLYDYFSIHCMKLNDEGKLVLNRSLIEINDKEIVIDVIIFKDDWDLLMRLLKFPICGRVKIIQIVMDAILCRDLNEKVYSDLSDKGVCIIT